MELPRVEHPVERHPALMRRLMRSILAVHELLRDVVGVHVSLVIDLCLDELLKDVLKGHDPDQLILGLACAIGAARALGEAVGDHCRLSCSGGAQLGALRWSHCRMDDARHGAQLDPAAIVV